MRLANSGFLHNDTIYLILENSLSFRPTLAPLAIPKLNKEIKKRWLQLDLNPQPCSKLLHVFGLCFVCCWWLA